MTRLLPVLIALVACRVDYGTPLTERSMTLFGPPPATPAQPFDPAGPVEAYVRHGLEHHPGLHAAFDRFRAAIEAAPIAGSLPDPMFSYSYFAEPLETRTGPQRQRFTLSQPLPWFGKLEGRERVAVADAERHWWSAVAKRSTVVANIEQRYWDYAYLARETRIARDTLGLLRQLESIAAVRVQAGGGQGELLRLQIEIAKLENDVASLESVRRAASSRLGTAIHWHEIEVLPLPSLPEPTLVAVNRDELRRVMSHTNPELEGLAQTMRAAEARRDLADLSPYPDWQLGVSYFETGEARMPGTPGSGDDPISLNVSLNLPIGVSRYSAERRAAGAAIDGTRRALTQRANELRAELELVLHELGDSARTFELHRDSLVPRARRAYALMLTAYRTGDRSLTDVFDVQRELLTLEKHYWKACADYLRALARLKALCGGELP